MKAEDTVMKAGDLCIKVCQDHRSRTLEAKNCTGIDCEECQLKAQAGISFKAGIKHTLSRAVGEGCLSTVKGKHGVHIPDKLYEELSNESKP